MIRVAPEPPVRRYEWSRRLVAFIVRHPVVAYRHHRAVTALWPIEMTQGETAT